MASCAAVDCRVPPDGAGWHWSSPPSPRTIRDVREPNPGVKVMVDRHRTMVAWQVLNRFGGRYSKDLAIDVDRGEAEVERWFLASALFATRRSDSAAGRIFRVFGDAGLARIAQIPHVPFADLATLLDSGGHTHSELRTAELLCDLADVVAERYEGQIAEMAQRYCTYPELRVAVEVLPGWGPATAGRFLRELRGVWSGAEPPLEEKVAHAGRHLRILHSEDRTAAVSSLISLAWASRIDRRDLEVSLERLALAHHGGIDACDGELTTGCRVLSAARAATA
jgi:hypothetical protein